MREARGGSDQVRKAVRKRTSAQGQPVAFGGSERRRNESEAKKFRARSGKADDFLSFPQIDN